MNEPCSFSWASGLTALSPPTIIAFVALVAFMGSVVFSDRVASWYVENTGECVALELGLIGSESQGDKELAMTTVLDLSPFEIYEAIEAAVSCLVAPAIRSVSMPFDF